MKKATLAKLTDYIIHTIWDAGFCPTSGPREPSEEAKRLYAELTADDQQQPTEEEWPAPLGTSGAGEVLHRLARLERKLDRML